MSWTVGPKDADGWTIAPKGSTVPIQKNEFVVGVGWDAKQMPGGPDFDLDVGVFFVDGRGKMTAPTDFVYYGSRFGPNNSVQLTQDDRTGAAQGDDEQVVCDLSLVPAQYQKAIVMVTINDAAQRRQNFSMVRNCYVRLFVPRFFSMNGQRLEMQTPLLKFNLAEEYGHNTAVVFCELYREGHVWNFRAVGKGFMGGFQEMMGLLRP